MNENGPELFVPTTDRDELPGGAAATASPGPYDPAELVALIDAVWSLEDENTDLTRFHDLLHAAVVFLGRVALDPYALSWKYDAAALLRSMEQRALWGPDHPVRQP